MEGEREDRVEVMVTMRPETARELLELVPSARSRQEAILFAAECELERRRQPRSERDD
jgi:hypothetical protein